MKKYTLEAVVFVSGAVVMILEITGSRILAPYLGSSTFVWTSLIGIILASLSLGYHLGGKLADKKPKLQILSKIIFIAALLIALPAILHQEILQVLEHSIQDLRLAATVGTIILFAPASLFLGMISPYAIRLKLENIQHSGEIVGRLYAISTLGSIVGTFAAGFFLLAYIGSTSLLFLLSLTMLILSFVLSPDKKKIFVFIFTAIYLGININRQNLAEAQGFIDLDTDYNRVQIFPSVDYYTGRETKTLSLGKNNSSAIFPESPNELVFQYTKAYDLAFHFNPQLKKALIIGGGAYSYPKHFLAKNPEAEIDVVEIDPELSELAQKYFGLKLDPRLKIFHEDGRTFLNRNEEKYGAIFGDAFRGSYAIPAHLSTTEAVEKISQSLDEQGVYIVNVIGKLEGPGSEFFKAEYKTIAKHFPQTFVIPVRDATNTRITQNIMILGLKTETAPSFYSREPSLNKFLENRYKKAVTTDLPILRDDFAPVDHYIMKLL